MKFLYLFTIVFTVFAVSSCKKCDPSNSIGGEVIEGTIVRAMGHPWEDRIINEQGIMNIEYEVSFNNGVSYSPVDFGKYSVLCHTTRANCSSGYHRSVAIDHGEQVVTYTIDITECDDCEAQARLYNWVLIPAVPNSYEYITITNKK